MTLVIDVAGVMEIILHKGKAGKFNKLLHEAGQIIAPDLYVSELANTLWKYYRANEYSLDKCSLYIRKGIELVDKFISSKELWQEAFAEGVNNKHSIYDMFYMVAARRYGGIVVTSDSVLAAICKKNHVQVCF